jgi:hypothetical protein
MPDDISQPLPESSPRLWFAMLAGPIAWSAHLLLSYALVPIACDTGWSFLLVVVTAVTALASLTGALVSRRLPGSDIGNTPDTRLANASERTRFITHAGFTSGIFFTIVIIIQSLPIFFLDPCSWGS